MEAQPENTPKPVIDVKEQDKLMMPKDFKNLHSNQQSFRNTSRDLDDSLEK